MILENMNSKEKLGQMSSILSILEDRVDSYIERNRSNLRRRLKTAERTRIQREFSLGTNGKWEVDMFILKVSKDYIPGDVRCVSEVLHQICKRPSEYRCRLLCHTEVILRVSAEVQEALLRDYSALYQQVQRKMSGDEGHQCCRSP